MMTELESELALNENWNVLLTMLPSNWQELAKETKALERKLRSFRDEESILRTLLLHLGNGYSLRETAVRAKMGNLADVTDVALLKRLKCSEEWLKALSMSLLRERGIVSEASVQESPGGIQMKLVDGTHVKEPGKTGSQWRIHYSLKLPSLECDYFKLTETEGKGTGESLKQFPVNKDDCIIGDRGYSTAQGISYLEKHHAYSIIRVNTGSLVFYEEDDRLFDLHKHIKCLKKTHAIKEWDVKIKEGEKDWIMGRLCVLRKSGISAQRAIDKLKKEASSKQKIKLETIEFAKYVIVFTTLPKKDYPADRVLDWYRLRWQIELVFKRLKSLTGFGHLPKYDAQSARAWLYGKLFVGLLIEKLIQYANAFSPWGYDLSQNTKLLERV